MFIDKVITLTLGAVFLLLLACEGPASERREKRKEAAIRTLLQEPAFWDYAASNNMLQVEIGKVVAEKGSTERIKSMAQEAVNYHSKALKDLQRLVRRHKSIQLPDTLAAADQGLVQEFRLLEGAELNARYRDFIISTHKAQLTSYEEALAKAQDQRTRNWILDMHAHLRKEISELAELDSTEVALEEL